MHMFSESDAVEMVARLMALSARTAPKARGVDVIKTQIVAGEERNVLAGAMREFGERHNVAFFIRDAANVAASDACLLVGSLFADATGLDCGACGAPSCRALAEDIVRGMASETDCIFKLRERVRDLAAQMVELEGKIPPVMDRDQE